MKERKKTANLWVYKKKKKKKKKIKIKNKIWSQI